MEVLSFLELKDVPAIELVCKTFKAISNQACLWRKRLKTVFPNISPQVIMSIKDQMKIHYIAYKNAITKFNQKEAELKTQVQAILGPNGSDGLRSKAFKLYSICEKQVSKKIHRWI